MNTTLIKSFPKPALLYQLKPGDKFRVKGKNSECELIEHIPGSTISVISKDGEQTFMARGSNVIQLIQVR